ncbi:cuticle protein 8-like [Oratosquilla oratoria]|uniref:cuticle protein 8-like n=1 Tax=Oratosquilla oratoria TaxID=337810 RepID=UPI003F770524
MYKLVVFLLAAAIAVMAMPHAPAHYQGQDHHPGHGHHSGHHDQPLMPYKFEYKVQDPYSGVNQERQEYSDGNKAAGTYKVDLPNGLTQVVNYQADKYSGFQADVQFVPSQKSPAHYH